MRPASFDGLLGVPYLTLDKLVEWMACRALENSQPVIEILKVGALPRCKCARGSGSAVFFCNDIAL